MCAAGIPIANRTHMVDIVLAALGIQQKTNELALADEAAGRPGWYIRLGIHTGPLAAGIIGSKKFIYDIWGDTVNIASRMETAGLPGKVNISGDTAQLISDFFVLEERGMIEAKNKGLLPMFLVLGIKPELSKNGLGIYPNEAFNLLRDNL